jgi:hypothetical protein
MNSMVAMGPAIPGKLFHRAAMLLALVAAPAIAVAQSPSHAPTRPPAHAAAHPLSPADEIIAQESNFSKLSLKGNETELKKIVPEDYVSVAGVITHREDLFAGVRKFQSLVKSYESYGCSLSQIKLIDPKVTFLSPEIAIIVYRPQIDAACYGEHARVVGLAGSMWVRSNGRWQLQMQTYYADAR